MVETNKKVESDTQYHYVLPESVSKERLIGPIGSESSETLPLIQDQLIPSQSQLTSPKTAPPIDAPELPTPTAKALQVAAIKRAVAEQAKKNPWIANPSYMGAFLSVYFTLMNSLRDSRYNESEMKRIMETSIFELGMSNADEAKAAKEASATKEQVQAISAFTKAGISMYQAGSLMKSRGQATEEANKSDTFGKAKMDEQQKKITTLEDDKAKNLLGSDTLTDQTLKDAVATRNATYDKDIATEKSNLEKLKQENRSEIRENIRQLDQMSQVNAEAMKQTVEGATGIIVSLHTLHEGEIEKLRTTNQALLDYFNKLNEGINRAKDELISQMDRLMQQATQTSSENVKAHQIGRG